MRISVEEPKNRVGIALFWIAMIWAIAWGVVGGVTASSIMNRLTPAELDQTVCLVRNTGKIIENGARFFDGDAEIFSGCAIDLDYIGIA